MRGSALSVGPAGLALALFGPFRKAVRPSLPASKPATRRAVPVRRRVAIGGWQTHSWTAKIVQGSFEPTLPERVRVLRDDK